MPNTIGPNGRPAKTRLFRLLLEPQLHQIAVSAAAAIGVSTSELVRRGLIAEVQRIQRHQKGAKHVA